MFFLSSSKNPGQVTLQLVNTDTIGEHNRVTFRDWYTTPDHGSILEATIGSAVDWEEL